MMDNQRYSFSDDFQDLLLACLIRHPQEFALQGEVIAPKFFNGSAAFDACYEIKEYAKKQSGAIPTFTILGNLIYQRYATRNPDRAKECVEYIKKLALIDTAQVKGVRDMVIDFARERAIQSALRVAMDASYKGEEVKGGLVKLFEDAINVGSNMDDIGLWLHTDQDIVRERLSSKDYGVPTGYKLLDDVWKRGWGKGWLIVPLAPPKRFKSTFCLNLALQMAGHAINADIFYYACEISEELAFMRALLNVTGRTEEMLYTSAEQFWQLCEVQVPLATNGNVMFKSFPSKTATIAQIKAHAKNVIQQTGISPKAIVIDYAETVRSASEKGTSDWRAQAEIYTDARAMGAELGCCIIMPDRCNADAVDKKVPSMKSFQGSFEKAGIVDAAIGLCATESEHKQGICRYFIFINRHGPQYLHFRGKVDAASYKMTIDEEIDYDPDAEEAEAAEKAAARKGGGSSGGVRRRRSTQGIETVALDEDGEPIG